MGMYVVGVNGRGCLQSLDSIFYFWLFFIYSRFNSFESVKIALFDLTLLSPITHKNQAK